ncbi:Crp/Fnr family transcriptional regulator [Xanthomonas sp. Kuri4-2]
MCPPAELLKRDRSHLGRLLTDAQWARLHGIASVQHHPAAGLAVYRQGEPAEAAYLLTRGMVELSSTSEAGRRTIVSFLRPGDLFGPFEHERYLNTACTLSPVQLYRLPLLALGELLVSDARLQLGFLAKAAHDLGRAQQHLIVLGQNRVQQRLAAFLVDFVDNGEFWDAQARLVTLPMRRSAIADYLAVAPESLARALLGMEKRGLLRRVPPQGIRIDDLDGLRRQVPR